MEIICDIISMKSNIIRIIFDFIFRTIEFILISAVVILIRYNRTKILFSQKYSISLTKYFVTKRIFPKL